ncbi:hypothetical protein [Bradyrhizobium sp. BR 1432]|uniref:hypothetical protein n=1 Tax=Bradyrhizobium sp. BR 1432 TaxID=3447966 RepID=UPI003EE619B5
MIDRRRVLKALSKYPVYSPPFHNSEAVLSRSEIAANYNYFLEQKARRLEFLASYLRHFFVELSLSPEALPALDNWLLRYGGHLIPNGGEVLFAMNDYEPAWVGEYHGVNIIHDISIFAGDYIVMKNDKVRWSVNYGDGTKRDYEEIGFGQPCLVGLSHFAYTGNYSIFHGIYEFCYAGLRRLRNGGRGSKWERDIPGELVRRLNYLADPDPPPQIPVSQLTIDD